MYYYRIKEIEIDGEFFFLYLEHEKKFTIEEFKSHLEQSIEEWIVKQPDKLQITIELDEHVFSKALFEVLTILKKKFGYHSMNVELTVEYSTNEYKEVEGEDYHVCIEKLKESGFKKEEIYEEGFINNKMDYRYLEDRKLRKRGKKSLQDKESYIYRLKENNGPTYFYPLINNKRLSKNEFLNDLENVRKLLVRERGIKEIIGIEIANKLCNNYGYVPINFEATATFDKESHYIKKGKNRYGFVVEGTGRVDFENDYPYRRDKDEEYLIPGNKNDGYRYFSEKLSQKEQPRLIQYKGIWYAYNEYREGNYKSKIEENDVKIITIDHLYSGGYNYCEKTDKKYPQRVKEAIKNSIALEKEIIIK